MKSKDKQLLVYALTANADKLISKVSDLKDLTINIKATESFINRGKIVKITIPEILKMTMDVWEYSKNETSLKNYKEINPNKYYNNSKRALSFFKKKYPSIKVDVPYHKYIFMIYCFDEEDNWIENEEFEELRESGLREINLDLINAAVGRNTKKVKQLLDKGADPLIEVDEGMEYGSSILDLLSTDDSCHSIDYIGCLKSIKKSKKIKRKYLYYMLCSLYASASSSAIFDLIYEYCNIDYDNVNHRYVRKDDKELED